MIAQKLGNEDAALYRFTHPVKPEQPMVPAQKPALSDTVVERDPSLKPSHKPSPHVHSQMQPAQKPLQQSGKGQGSIGGASHPPRKGAIIAPQYAAGSAKTPIMLAEIKV